MSRVRQYSTFFVDRLHFGVQVDHVQEALLPIPTTPVPRTTDVVDGLINLRGQIVMAIDLRARLDMPRRDAGQPSVSLILRTAHGLISLRVDHLGDVLDLDAMSMEPLRAVVGDEEVAGADTAEDLTKPLWEALPDTVHGPLRELVQGISKLDKSLLLVLDPDLLANPDACLLSDEMTCPGTAP
ncbi:MAG: chemotaxis protein CheW [Pirellulaceae bacterium]